MDIEVSLISKIKGLISSKDTYQNDCADSSYIEKYYDVFISYSSKDKNVADAICSKLESSKIKCWIAPRDILPGAAYAESIVQALSRVNLLVLVYSKHVASSPHVIRELERAVSRKIAIIPLRIHDVTPEGEMEYYISQTHWLDALTVPLEKHLAKLVNSVRAVLDMYHEPATASEDLPVGPDQPNVIGANRDNYNPSLEAIFKLTMKMGESVGTVYLLDNTRMSIGRAPHCDVVVNDSRCSRTQNFLWWDEDQGTFIIDSTGAIGTLVNNKSLKRYAHHPLRPGDIITIGRTVFEFGEIENSA